MTMVVYDGNRVCYRRYQGLTGIERPVYDVAISYRLTSKREASQNVRAQVEMDQRDLDIRRSVHKPKIFIPPHVSLP